MANRSCGDCQLCCKLLPVKDDPARGALFAAMGLTPLTKSANTKCPHQSHARGCKIYARRPFSCMAFSCRWLVDPKADKLSRPDRTHYVIDPMPDFVVMRSPEGEEHKVIVAQIWCDPDYPDAYRDPALRDYLRAIDMPALVRSGSFDGVFLVHVRGQWHEQMSIEAPRPQHSAEEIVAASAEATKLV